MSTYGRWMEEFERIERMQVEWREGKWDCEFRCLPLHFQFFNPSSAASFSLRVSSPLPRSFLTPSLISFSLPLTCCPLLPAQHHSSFAFILGFTFSFFLLCQAQKHVVQFNPKIFQWPTWCNLKRRRTSMFIFFHFFDF